MWRSQAVARAAAAASSLPLAGAAPAAPAAPAGLWARWLSGGSTAASPQDDAQGSIGGSRSYGSAAAASAAAHTGLVELRQYQLKPEGIKARRALQC